MAQLPPPAGLNFEQIKHLIVNVTYGEVVPPLPPSTVLSYEEMEELLRLHYTVAQAVRPRSPRSIEVFCEAIMTKVAVYWAEIAQSRREDQRKPWAARNRRQLKVEFINQFKPSRSGAKHPLGDLLGLPVFGALVKQKVEKVYQRMMDSAGQVSHLSKKLVIAHRDWDSWDGETIMGCYYRARAVEAAVVYQRWIDLKHQQYIDHIIANFGDFPDHPPPAHSLAHSVYVPHARSAQDRRAWVERALEA